MPVIARPAPGTANAVISRQEAQAGQPIKQREGWWLVRVNYTHFTTAGTQQVLTLNTLFPTNTFPTEVFLQLGPIAYLDLIQTFGGGTINAATLILGISGTTNGLVTSTNVFTGQTLARKAPGGSLYANTTDYQSAMSPLLQLDTTAGNVNTLTSGIVDVYIPYSFAPQRRTGLFLS